MINYVDIDCMVVWLYSKIFHGSFCWGSKVFLCEFFSAHLWSYFSLI